MPKPEDIPACPPEPKVRSSGRKTREYLIHLITPLFGGGAEAGKPDPSLPIRGTSVRGQLQFWWRATRGAAYSTGEELFTRHAAVWGTTEQASPIEVAVRDVRPDKLMPCAEYTPNYDGKLQLRWRRPFTGTALDYALFPFQGQPSKDRRQVEKAPAEFIENASFCLRVRFPEALRQDVETAVWAWVNFGGLGARTRRGCGSLLCQELAPKDEKQLGGWVSQAGPPVNAVRAWPTAAASLLIRPKAGDPIDVWDWMIGRFKHFRQGEDFARDPGPSRSRYPEPDTIRRITGQWWERHAPRDKMPDGFPRAELGLPIVFHFKDDKRGDPPQMTLNPFVGGEVRERMASPLILKPLGLATGKAVPLILRLATTGVQQVELQGQDGNCLTHRHAVPVQDKSFALPGSPFHGLSTSGSALEAFVNFARLENGFEEYTR